MDERKYPACGANLRYGKSADFPTGGHEGLWKRFLGEWAALDETMIPFDMYMCPTCRRIEFSAK